MAVGVGEAFAASLLELLGTTCAVWALHRNRGVETAWISPACAYCVVSSLLKCSVKSVKQE